MPQLINIATNNLIYLSIAGFLVTFRQAENVADCITRERREKKENSKQILQSLVRNRWFFHRLAGFGIVFVYLPGKLLFVEYVNLLSQICFRCDFNERVRQREKMFYGICFGLNHKNENLTFNWNLHFDCLFLLLLANKWHTPLVYLVKKKDTKLTPILTSQLPSEMY